MTKPFTRVTQSYTNPVVHILKYDTIDYIKSYILTVLILPIRIFLILICILVGWLLGFIGLLGLSDEELDCEPLSPWRKIVLDATTFTMRMAFFFGSFMYFRVKGKQATRLEAPILVVAPHSSYTDAMAIIQTGSPSCVVRESSKDAIFVGKLVKLIQAIVVARESSSSRRTTIEKICERAKSTLDWPQILIFPEGTTTNRTALLKFKPGAFVPGVPVQPICIRYPNRCDTVTWTWDGMNYIKIAWLTLTQFYSNFEIEYLPVYKPNTEEIADANLFAENVRKVMAKALNVPVSDFIYEDCKQIPNAKYFNIPFYKDIIEIKRLRNLISGNNLKKEEEIAFDYTTRVCDELITFEDFATIFEFNEDDCNVCSLFKLFDQNHCGKIAIKDYLICIIYIAKQNDLLIDFLTSISHIYCQNLNFITREQFYEILKHCIVINDEINDLFFKLDTKFCGTIKFDDFLQLISHDKIYEYFFVKIKDANQ